ncbi:MAG: DUF2304 domain-containing protein [Candidatus Buchananbacteria bacterium]
MLIQIILVLVILLTLSRIWLKYRAQEVSGQEFLAWLIFWLGAGLIVLNPGWATSLANILGVGRGSDLAVYLAVLGLYYLIFKIFLRLAKLEKNLTKLTRQEALKKEEDD